MKTMRYLRGVATVIIHEERCVGCTMCTMVCPHHVFEMNDKKAVLVDSDGCMECGACAKNCPVEAIGVRSGVGCAAMMISSILKKKNLSAGGCC